MLSGRQNCMVTAVCLHNVRQGAAHALQKECEEGRTVLAFWQTRLDALLPANASGISSGCAALAAAGRIQTQWHGAVFSELRVCVAARVMSTSSNEH
jgi:putative hemolysin